MRYLHRMRGCLYRLSAGLGSVLLCLALLEVILRVRDAVSGSSQDARTSWYWLYEQDPFLGYRGRPHAHRTTSTEVIVHDAEGFRDDRDFRDVLALKDRRLVVCVGESSTYGLSASGNGTTYPAVLEKELRRLSGDTRWVVFNAGMAGYTSHEILELINLTLLKLKPSAIVTMNLRNDHEFYARSLDDAQDYDRFPIRLAPLSRTWGNEALMRSALYGFLAGRTRGWWVDDLGGSPPARVYEGATERGLKLYLDNLAMTSLLCKRSGVRFLCVDQPVDLSGYTSAKARSLAKMREALAVFCRESSLDLLEANSRFDWKGLTSQDDVHPGTLGYERLAKLLAPQVLATLDPSHSTAAKPFDRSEVRAGDSAR